jgi:hypothetical protein
MRKKCSSYGVLMPSFVSAAGIRSGDPILTTGGSAVWRR